MISPISPRRYARNTRSSRIAGLFSCLSLLGLAALAGCGGGGGSSHHNNPPPSTGEINGTVTDANNAPIVGATVRFGTQSASSTQFGSYIIPNISVPSGQTSLVGNVTATATIKGVAYSGQNQVEVLSTDSVTRNAQIVLSPTATQGSIIGVVLDASSNRVAGARVFANVGPFTVSGGTGQFYNNLSSFNTTSGTDGTFTLPAIPPGTQYTVTASQAGKLNATVTNVTVASASSTSITLTLGTATGSSTVPTPTGLFAQTITAPLNPTRAAGSAGTTDGFLNVIRHILLEKRGLLAKRSAIAQKVQMKRSVTRSTPGNSLIEADLFWDIVDQPNVLGYDIIRTSSTSQTLPSDPGFQSIALVRDPQADRFADNDSTLTPDIFYFYSVATLDTINFPNNVIDPTSGIGESLAATPVTVEPLNVLTLISPASGSTASSSAPAFRWNSVNRASLYKVLVYDQFPTLQSDTDPNGVAPVWSADFNTTTATYAGPALVSGHTYYWAVLGQDSVASAFTVSPLQTFVAP